MGGQDNDDGNTMTSGEEVSSHGATTDTTVEEDSEVDIVVAVAAEDERGNNAEDERGNKKRLIYISIGVLVISVVVALALGVTLPARPSAAPTPLQRDSMISLIQSRSASTSFSNSSCMDLQLDQLAYKLLARVVDLMFSRGRVAVCCAVYIILQ